MTFSFFEAFFRYRYDQSDGLGFLRVNQKWYQRHVVYNNYFFRDRDFQLQKKEGVTRIGVIGDSLTFGQGIKNVDDRFSNILEKKLKQKDYKVEVYNLGVPGLDFQAEAEKYDQVKQLNFDIIIWEYFLNDIEPKEGHPSEAIMINAGRKGNLTKKLDGHSYFFDYLYWRYQSKWQKTLMDLRQADLELYANREKFDQHKAEMSDFIDSLKNDNKKVIVIVFPLFAFLGPNYPAVDIHNQLDQFFKTKDIPIIDMYDYLKNRNGSDLWVSEFDSHPNKEVHSLAAEKLFEKIIPLLNQ